MSDITKLVLTRRQFLAASSKVSAAFILSFQIPISNKAHAENYLKNNTYLNGYIALNKNGQVTVFNPFVEMGQGTYTAIPMLIAEELDIPLAKIHVEQAEPGEQYRLLMGNTQRFTGGSFSVRSAFLPMRKAGASARQMFINAAAELWQVNPEECSTKSGRVIHKSTGNSVDYGQLAERAAQLTVPQDVLLKSRDQFSLLGHEVPRLDCAVKSNGKAIFGIDIKIPGIAYAALKQSSVRGAKIANLEAIRSQLQSDQIIAIEEIPNGLAVIAKQYWLAQKALNEIEVEYEPALADREQDAFSTSSYQKKLIASLDLTGVTVESSNNLPSSSSNNKQTLTSDYSAPLLAHATMEPMNCTALFTQEHCTVWAPNQSIDRVIEAVIEVTGKSPEQITVHTPFLGGGFGRRFMMDFVKQAVLLAQKHPLLPIKLIWSREEDTQHDFYRPQTACRLRAAINSRNQLESLHITSAGDGPFRRHLSQPDKPMNIDHSVVEGLFQYPYKIPQKRCDYVYVPIDAPIGFWRSVGHSMNAFFLESFIDEIAHAVDQDPAEYRLALLREQPRFQRVLKTVMKMAAWQKKPWTAINGSTHAMGIAIHESFGTVVAQVAEVSIESNQQIKAHRVWCVVDCGFAVNPKIVTMQIESAIAYGLSAALKERITISEGNVEQTNFDNYPILTAQQMPEIQVKILQSDNELGGIGEPGTPPIAPAVANAIFNLTGKRLRHLPLQLI